MYSNDIAWIIWLFYTRKMGQWQCSVHKIGSRVAIGSELEGELICPSNDTGEYLTALTILWGKYIYKNNNNKWKYLAILWILQVFVRKLPRGSPMLKEHGDLHILNETCYLLYQIR